MRRDVKSCGCKGTNPFAASAAAIVDPLVGLYFLARNAAPSSYKFQVDENSKGKVLAKVGQYYLVGDGKNKTLVPASIMAFWEFKNKPWSKQENAACLGNMKGGQPAEEN